MSHWNFKDFDIITFSPLIVYNTLAPTLNKV